MHTRYTRHFRRLAALSVAALAATFVITFMAAPLRAQGVASAAGAPAQQIKYEKKWRIVCNRSATSAGTITFVLTPKGGAPQDLTVTIAKPVSENAVAREIRDQLKAQLDPKLYEVETDDGEDVLVKRQRGAADFALAKTFGSVESVQITVRRD